jgi:NDP-sugar pyrophosphorylase family protein
MGDVIEEHFGDGRAFGCAIEYLREQQPLGTGGALSLVPEKTEHDLVVLNGDLLTQFDASRMLDFHASGRYKATVGVHQYVHIVPYGVVEYSEERITSLREKPAQSWATNAGIYVIAPELLGRVPRETHFPLPALIEDCLQRGEPVGAFAIGDDWIDVGQPTDLSRARGDG